jgi:hypothetical protein
MGNVNTDLAAVTYLASYDIPLNITIMSKTQQWAFQQQLAYNAMLPYICKDFHGLQDFYTQMSMYSAANPIYLAGPWSTIQAIVPLNSNIQKEMYIDPNLGQVGDLFAQLPGFGKVFSVSSVDDSNDISEAVG